MDIVEKALNTFKGQKKKELKAVFESLMKGASITRACQAAGLDFSGLWRIRKKYPEVEEAIEFVLESRIAIVEDALYKRAVEGNVTAQIFWLCNRAPDRWKNIQHVEAKGTGFGNVEIHIHDAKEGKDGKD